MKTYETSATVEDQGQVHVAGVPFAAGTEVAITITPTTNGAKSPSSADLHRAAGLFAALDKARNSETVGPLSRAELYDRGNIH